MWAISRTACSKIASFAFDGFVVPLILRTYWRAAACTSSSVAGGSKLWSCLMFLHTVVSSPVGGVSRRRSQRRQLSPQFLDLVAKLGGVLEAKLLGRREHFFLEGDGELLELCLV